MQLKRRIIYLAGFLFSVPIALTSYINSSFLERYASRYDISLIYVVASLASIIGMFRMPALLSRLGNRLTTLLLSLGLFASFALLGSTDDAATAIAAFIVSIICGNLLIVSFDIFVEDFSGKGSIGTFRGLYLSIMNLAWIAAQILSGVVIADISFTGMYLMSAGFMALVCLLFAFSLRGFADPAYRKVSFLQGVRFFLRRKNLLKIYAVNLILKFFYAWMVIYTPIYLHEYMGFDWSRIAVIFTVMLIPFLSEFSLGKLSDKVGEKKMLLAGFAIAAVSTGLMGFMGPSTLAAWAAVLFATRVGAAMVEVMSENYFFKSVPEDNLEALAFFRNTSPVSYVIAPLIAVPVLFFIPAFSYLFPVLGAILLGGFYISLRLKDVK